MDKCEDDIPVALVINPLKLNKPNVERA